VRSSSLHGAHERWIRIHLADTRCETALVHLIVCVFGIFSFCDCEMTLCDDNYALRRTRRPSRRKARPRSHHPLPQQQLCRHHLFLRRKAAPRDRLRSVAELGECMADCCAQDAKADAPVVEAEPQALPVAVPELQVRILHCFWGLFLSFIFLRHSLWMLPCLGPGYPQDRVLCPAECVADRH